MGGFSLVHWLILGVVVLLLFGKGRFSDMMGDVAKGLKSFKKGMADDDALPPVKHLEGQRTPDPTPMATPTNEQDKL
ncbi:MAG: twin-arginine translocase TatA/TatE family subunit [Sphingopyxis sp.]|jgi:sec-independent protein translocase protein TatA|uniref:twin-arginine translocase TatA/TatE family subunit n=1 Tax=Sphingopyxis sp. TaxID=1908224 RepID=UPI003D6C8557